MFLICFSIDSPDSFEHVKSKWWPEVQHHCAEAAIMLVGTKSDLRASEHAASQLAAQGLSMVSREAALERAKEIGAVAYMECSAFTQEGLKNLFDEAIRAAIRKQAPKHTQRKCTIL